MDGARKVSRAWVIAAAVIGVGVVGLGLVLVIQSSRGGAGARVQRSLVPLDDRPSQGPEDALVTIVEFSDFQ